MSWRNGNGKVNKKATDHYGNVIGGGGATIDDFEDSETIVYEETTLGKVTSHIDGDVQAKIQNSLQVPLTTPTSTELVGIGTNKDQARITVGDGLTIEDNELKVEKKIIRLETAETSGTFTQEQLNLILADPKGVIIEYARPSYLLKEFKLYYNDIKGNNYQYIAFSVTTSGSKDGELAVAVLEFENTGNWTFKFYYYTPKS